MISSAKTPPTTIPTGPVQSIPKSNPTTATKSDMTKIAPRFGTRATKYIHTMPPGMAPMACVNQNVLAFMPSTIANTKNTMNKSTPKIAMKMKSLPVSLPEFRAFAAVTM